MAQDNSTYGWVIRTAVSVLALGLLIVLTARLTASEPYLPFAIAGASAFWYRCRPSKKEWLLWVAALPIVVLSKHFPKANDPVLWAATVSALFGLASFLSLTLRVIWSRPALRARSIAALTPACLMPVYIISAQHMLIIAQAVHATTLDLYLHKFDGSLGFQPSFCAGMLLLDHAFLRWICLLVYYSLPLAMSIAYAGSAKIEEGRLSWRMVLLFVTAGLCGWIFYNFFPATGPRYVFQFNFPWPSLPYMSLKRLLLEPIVVSQAVPRNAMPSLHLTWLILIWWSTRTSPWHVRVFALLYLLLTALGTLGTGEHYLIDLIVAWPFALMVQGFFLPLGVRWRGSWIAIGFGLTLTAAWNIGLRHLDFFFASRILPWLAIALTVLVTELLRRDLFERVDKAVLGDGRTQPLALDPAIMESST